MRRQKKLITDFNLPIPLKEQKSVQNKSRDREGKKVQSRYHFSVKSKVKTWKNHAVKVLTDYLSWIRFWKQFYGSEPEPFEQECFVEALDNERKINDYLDILLTGDGEEIAEFSFINGRRWRRLSSEWKNISEESWKKLEKIVEDEMLSTEEIRGSLEVTEKGRIRQSIQNCKHVLEHDPCLKGAICRK